jgi:hypothetical protein
VEADGFGGMTVGHFAGEEQAGKGYFLIGDGVVLHSCRHTMLTRIGEAGADAFTIIKSAEHLSVTVGQRYVHPHGSGGTCF